MSIIRSAICNQTDWIESGFAVYYSYRHLKEHGKLSSDSLLPWKRIVEEVLNVARKHSQTYITVWYPSTFGKSSDVYNHMHQVIIQKIIPTRTGLNLMSSTVVVWLAKVNDTKPIVHPKTYRKPWTKEDHWTKYKSEINSSTKSFDIAVEAA